MDVFIYEHLSIKIRPLFLHFQALHCVCFVSRSQTEWLFVSFTAQNKLKLLDQKLAGFGQKKNAKSFQNIYMLITQ